MSYLEEFAKTSSLARKTIGRKLVIFKENHTLSEIEGSLKRRCTVTFLLRLPRVNPFTPNDPYRGRTAPLTSKICILYIYSTNISTEYFKHGIRVYSPFFSLFKMQFVS